MQTALAESEARQTARISNLESENTLLRQEVVLLKTKTVKLETDLAAKVDQSNFDGHWHGVICGRGWKTTKPPYNRGY